MVITNIDPLHINGNLVIDYALNEYVVDFFIDCLSASRIRLYQDSGSLDRVPSSWKKVFISNVQQETNSLNQIMSDELIINHIAIMAHDKSHGDRMKENKTERINPSLTLERLRPR